MRNLDTSSLSLLPSLDSDCAEDSTWLEAEPVSPALLVTSPILPVNGHPGADVLERFQAFLDRTCQLLAVRLFAHGAHRQERHAAGGGESGREDRRGGDAGLEFERAHGGDHGKHPGLYGCW